MLKTILYYVQYNRIKIRCLLHLFFLIFLFGDTLTSNDISMRSGHVTFHSAWDSPVGKYIDQADKISQLVLSFKW